MVDRFVEVVEVVEVAMQDCSQIELIVSIQWLRNEWTNSHSNNKNNNNTNEKIQRTSRYCVVCMKKIEIIFHAYCYSCNCCTSLRL